MSKINNGGPAYPCAKMSSDGERIVYENEGMSLRDAIAIAVLPAIIEADGIQYASNVTARAVWAYEQADAMLAARETKL